MRPSIESAGSKQALQERRFSEEGPSIESRFVEDLDVQQQLELQRILEEKKKLERAEAEIESKKTALLLEEQKQKLELQRLHHIESRLRKIEGSQERLLEQERAELKLERAKLREMQRQFREEIESERQRVQLEAQTAQDKRRTLREDAIQLHNNAKTHVFDFEIGSPSSWQNKEQSPRTPAVDFNVDVADAFLDFAAREGQPPEDCPYTMTSEMKLAASSPGLFNQREWDALFSIESDQEFVQLARERELEAAPPEDVNPNLAAEKAVQDKDAEIFQLRKQQQQLEEEFKEKLAEEKQRQADALRGAEEKMRKVVEGILAQKEAELIKQREEDRETLQSTLLQQLERDRMVESQLLEKLDKEKHRRKEEINMKQKELEQKFEEEHKKILNQLRAREDELKKLLLAENRSDGAQQMGLAKPETLKEVSHSAMDTEADQRESFESFAHETVTCPTEELGQLDLGEHASRPIGANLGHSNESPLQPSVSAPKGLVATTAVEEQHLPLMMGPEVSKQTTANGEGAHSSFLHSDLKSCVTHSKISQEHGVADKLESHKLEIDGPIPDFPSEAAEAAAVHPKLDDDNGKHQVVGHPMKQWDAPVAEGELVYEKDLSVDDAMAPAESLPSVERGLTAQAESRVQTSTVDAVSTYPMTFCELKKASDCSLLRHLTKTRPVRKGMRPPSKGASAAHPRIVKAVPTSSKEESVRPPKGGLPPTGCFCLLTLLSRVIFFFFWER